MSLVEEAAMGPPETVLRQQCMLFKLVAKLETIARLHQRATTTSNAGLRAGAKRDRAVAVTRASMLIEWLRREFPGFDEELRKYMFTSLPLTESDYF
jgi:hypothetical protein